MEAESGGIALEYEVERQDKGLRLAYRVTNESEESIFLTTPLVSSDYIDVSDPERAYTFMDEEGVLHVTKRLWEVPDELDVYAPEVPRLTEVPSGCQFEEAVLLSVPVRMNVPYVDDASAGNGAPVETKGITLSIGYLLGEQVASLVANAKEDEAVVVDYATAAEGQHLLEGEVLGVKVVVEMGKD